MNVIKTVYERFHALPICLGKEGERFVSAVHVDVSTPQQQWPGAWFAIEVEAPDGTLYPAVCETEGDTLKWVVSDSDTAKCGKGKAQVVTYGENGEIERSKVVETFILRSVVAKDPPPDPIQNWLDNAQKLLEELKGYEVPIEQIEQIVREYLEENPPQGGGVSKEELYEAIDQYFAENPVVTAVTINGEAPDENGNFVINVLNDVEIAELAAVLT